MLIYCEFSIRSSSRGLNNPSINQHLSKDNNPQGVVAGKGSGGAARRDLSTGRRVVSGCGSDNGIISEGERSFKKLLGQVLLRN